MSHFFTSLVAYNTQRIQMNLCQYGFFILKTKHIPTFSNAVSLDRSLSYFWTVHFHTSGPSSLILSDRPLFSPGTIHLCLKDLPLSSVTVHFGSLGPSTLDLTLPFYELEAYFVLLTLFYSYSLQSAKIS